MLSKQLERFQFILNCATKIICGWRRNYRATPLLHYKLLWLCIHERVQHKCNEVCWCSKHWMALHHFTLLTSVKELLMHQVVVPSRTTKCGDCSFSVAGHTDWNILPENIKLSLPVDICKAWLETFFMPTIWWSSFLMYVSIDILAYMGVYLLIYFAFFANLLVRSYFCKAPLSLALVIFTALYKLFFIIIIINIIITWKHQNQVFWREQQTWRQSRMRPTPLDIIFSAM